MLYRSGLELFAYCIDQAVADVTVVAEHANFDEFVAFEVGINFASYRRCQSRISDHYDGLQVVGTGAQCATLGGCQIRHKVQFSRALRLIDSDG